MSITLILIWLVIFLVWYLYEKINKKIREYDEIGVPYMRPMAALQNFIKVMSMRVNFITNIDNIYQLHRNDKIYGLFSLTQRSFLVTDADLIKQITVKDFDSFVNHDSNFNEEIDKLSGKMLAVLINDEWRNMRNTLSPIFTSSKMKMMFKILSESANEFIDVHLEKSKNGQLIVDCKEQFSRYTVDGISTAVLGFKGDCVKNEESELFKFVQRMMTPSFSDSIKVLTFMVSRWLYIKLGFQMTKKEVYDFFHRVIVKVMKEREEKGIFRPDIIQLLIQSKKGQIKTENEVEEENFANFAANIEYDVNAKDKKITHWTDEHFMAQGFIFFGAGFETTNILLQMTSFYLARNKNYQQELIDEVDGVLDSLNGSPITYEALHKMKFLDMVISEVLRLFPPAAVTSRECNKDINFDLGIGRVVKIKTKDIFLIPIAAIHHDEKYFENPLEFNPHRFSDENKDKIVAGSYLPFGYGPRVCIGSRFALMEAKLLVFNILSNFTIEVCDKTPVEIELLPSFTQMLLKDRIFVEFKPRKKNE